MPSILARWVEEVFQHGFSHGLTGDKLKGKKIVASITTGALESVYSYEGTLKHPMEDFLVPLKSTTNLCGIEWAGYIHTGGVSYHNRKDEQKLVEMRDQSINHANRIVELLKML
jgi:putative NADPH-quinone reductase